MAETDVWRLDEALNELVVIASGIVSYKTVEHVLKIILLSNLKHNACHRTFSMVENRQFFSAFLDSLYLTFTSTSRSIDLC